MCGALRSKNKAPSNDRRWSEIDKHGEGFTPAPCISYLPTLAHEWGNGQKLVNISDMGRMGLVDWVVGGENFRGITCVIRRG